MSITMHQRPSIFGIDTIEKGTERSNVLPPDKSAYWKIIITISHPKHMLWVLKRTVSMSSFEHTKHMFKIIGKKIIKFYANKMSLSGSMMCIHQKKTLKYLYA